MPTMNQAMISVSKIEHKGDTRILLIFSLNDETKAKIKAISGSLYSSTHTAWHIPYTKESWKEFLKLDLPYQKQITGTTGSAKPISDHAGKKIADVPPTCTEQAADKIPISIKYYHPLFFVRGELTQHQIAEIKKVKNAYWNPKFGNWVLPATQESLDLFYQGLKVIKQNIYEQWSNQVASIIQTKVCTL